MRFPRQVRAFRGTFDFAPFAGVFFIMVIFVVLQSSVVYQPGVEIDIPVIKDQAGVEGPVLVAALDSSGQIYFDNQITSEKALLSSLRSELKRLGRPATFVIQADRSVEYAKIVRLSTLAQEAGIKRALLATRPNAVVQPVVNVVTNKP